MTALSEPASYDPLRDPRRLAVVRGTGLLDSPTEVEFDRLTRLAAKLTGAPVTFISLVDDGRDFYKSCFGFPEPLASERELTGTTFCHYALVSQGPLVIEDTLAHPIYREVPTVHSLGVRAYLGIPLKIGGMAIGSFCAIDFVARSWTPLQIEVMEELAASTMREIELRAAIDENRTLYEQARSANRAQDEFFATVSHELRTPMTAILGWSKLLIHEDLQNETAIEAAEAIAGSARLQAQLIDDLLDASRIATGKIALNVTSIDVNDSIEEAIRAAQPSAASHNVRLRTQLGQVPVIQGDAARIRQVVGNLLSNSIKFTPSGGLIEVTSRTEDGRAVITVCDTGRGIAPDLLPHVFEKHRQARTAEMGGLGLGLSIVRHLVEMHGGEVSVHSAGPGMGAEFTIRL
jgi:signal transduction histidine kinase